MVSTRGVKFKFCEGEKVLCYEPDPTKAKVLYDSKVLEVIVNKDSRGRKSVEYLIHFQGWNSSWDRCVGEDYVLKDTDDNRRLQRTLSDKAQLQLRERKQQARRRKTSDRTSDGAEDGGNGGSGGSGSSGGGGVRRRKRRRKVMGGKRRTEDGSSGGDGEEEEDEEAEEVGEEGFSSGEEDEEDEGRGDEEEEQDEDNEIDGKVPLSLSDNLKKLLEEDGDFITCRNKLIRLPANPNVVLILESFMKQYALNQLFPATMSPEKRKKQPRNQHRHLHSNGRNSCRPKDLNKAMRSLNLCKEVVDGIRIYFDHTLSGLLLYAQEKEQYEEEVASLASLSNSFRVEGRLSLSSKCASTKYLIKQEQTNSFDEPRRLHSEDFFIVRVKEEPKTSFGDSDREMTEPIQEMSFKSALKEEESFNQEKIVDDKGTKGCDRSKEACTDYKDDSYKISRIDSLNDIKTDMFSSFSGTFHNTMSSAASTSSCCSTPSCITTSNRPPSNVVPPTLHERTTSINSIGCTPSENVLLKHIMSWKLIPEVAAGVINAPSQLYGAIHLARLFVKLPDLLHAAGIHEKKLKLLIGYLHTFLEYLEEHTDWFGEMHYKENPSTLI